MFQDTRPAELDARGGTDPWAEFRVGHPQERLRLLRELRDCSTPVILNASDGSTLTTTLWAVDTAAQRLSFSAQPGMPQLARVVEAEEAVAVAYLASVKLQFDVHGLVLVRAATSCALHGAMPCDIYRFQRRGAYRVKPVSRPAPMAELRHPDTVELLTLRLLDVSSGGCALWLPHGAPPLAAGAAIDAVRVTLDDDTQFIAAARVQHAAPQAAAPGAPGGMRLGCEWHGLSGTAERTLQRWIDRTQQRQRLLKLG